VPDAYAQPSAVSSSRNLLQRRSGHTKRLLRIFVFAFGLDTFQYGLDPFWHVCRSQVRSSPDALFLISGAAHFDAGFGGARFHSLLLHHALLSLTLKIQNGYPKRQAAITPVVGTGGNHYDVNRDASPSEFAAFPWRLLQNLAGIEATRQIGIRQHASRINFLASATLSVNPSCSNRQQV
jgi:hypothetical protein